MNTGRSRPQAFEVVLLLLGSMALVACRGADENKAVYEEYVISDQPTQCVFTEDGQPQEDDCKVIRHAGSYAVVVKAGKHERGIVRIGQDATIDYDVDLIFPADDFDTVSYQGIGGSRALVVDMWPRPENDTSLARDAHHRITFILEGEAYDSPVSHIIHDPDWPSNANEARLDVIR